MIRKKKSYYIPQMQATQVEFTYTRLELLCLMTSYAY